MTGAPLLDVRGLSIDYRAPGHIHHAVVDASLQVSAGEIVAIVGESGSGKTTLAHALIGLPADGAQITGGAIEFESRELVRADEARWRRIRGRHIGLVPQDPGIALNPVHRIGRQVAEVLRLHRVVARDQRRRRVLELLAEAGLPSPEQQIDKFPHQLSGGQRQRVLIAIALAGGPRLIIADEPTSALDVTVQKRILDNLQLLAREHGTAVLLITHDLALAAERADRVLVMSRGRIVETGPARRVLESPVDPYTRRLVEALPVLGRTPPPTPLTQNATSVPIVEVSGLGKRFPTGRSGLRHTYLQAVDDVGFSIGAAETVALVGESGSGKSTVARLILRLLRSDSGSISFDGKDITAANRTGLREFRQSVQLVHQNPYTSLDPRFDVADLIAEPLHIIGSLRRADIARKVELLADRVQLPTGSLKRSALQLSGGQRQRVAIARALSVDPRLVVCDEAVSALDVSVQAQILDLLRGLQREHGTSYLFITHDIAVVQQVAHRTVVMQGGRVVESGSTDQVLDRPQNEYTKALIDSVPGRHLSLAPRAAS